MQLRPTSSLWISALLYWALIALSTSTVVAQETDNTGASTSQPHIAVVLPLQSASFGKHANSVRLGILAAAALPQEDGLGVTVYATTEDADQILTAYQRAVSRGARAVIGPLTRSGVTALALSGVVNVPTLALNIPDGDILMPRDLYAFGLQIEAEARQVAQFAHSHGGHRVFVVAGETALGGRIAQAFADEWRKRKGELAGQFVYSTEGAALAPVRRSLPYATLPASPPRPETGRRGPERRHVAATRRSRGEMRGCLPGARPGRPTRARNAPARDRQWRGRPDASRDDRSASPRRTSWASANSGVSSSQYRRRS